MAEPQEPVSPQRAAELCAQALSQRDPCAQDLGIELAEVRPGYARMTLAVTQTMVNGHGTCHGGMLFTLADTAFTYACNSRNRVTVASGASIDFLGPGRLGDTLIATAIGHTLTGRTGLYDVEITNQRGDLLAVFRGRSCRLQGELVPGLEIEA